MKVLFSEKILIDHEVAYRLVFPDDIFMLCSENNLEHFMSLSWNLDKDGYFRFTTNYRTEGKHTTVSTRAHHIPIGKPDPGFCINHKNACRVDNRASNLEIVTSRQNAQRKKINLQGKICGVVAKAGKFQALMAIGSTKNAPQFSLGMYETQELAARAYDLGCKLAELGYSRADLQLAFGVKTKSQALV